jgi:hypothetical protein
MLADAGAPAVLALAPLAVMFADAGAPAVLAPAPDAVMLADASAPAVLAPATLAVVLELLSPPLRCALPLPLPPSFPSESGLPLLVRIAGLLPRRVAVSPLLAAPAALAQLPPVPARTPLPPAFATGPSPTIILCPFATRTMTARPRQDHDLPRPHRRWRDGTREAHRRLRALRAPWRPSPRQPRRACRVEGAAGALGVAEGGRAADRLAAHGAVEGEGVVEQRGAAGGGRRGRGNGVLRLRHDR